MIEVPTDISQSILDELARILTEACERGDNVSAISERCGVARQMVSRMKNGTFQNSPTLETANAVAAAVGYDLTFKKKQ